MVRIAIEGSKSIKQTLHHPFIFSVADSNAIIISCHEVRSPPFMANAVAVYRDISLSDRNVDAGILAMMALDESVQPQPPPPPLPPLAFTRRVGSQNLPPVRNLLTQPEEWNQSNQNSSNESQQNNVLRQVWSFCRTN